MDNVLLLARDLQMKIQSNEDSAHKVLSNALHLQDIIHYTNEVLLNYLCISYLINSTNDF